MTSAASEVRMIRIFPFVATPPKCIAGSRSLTMRR
jgi:hypothetical protein